MTMADDCLAKNLAMYMCKPQKNHTRTRRVRRSCHVDKESCPLKIVRGSRQYIYDDTDTEYLDCINSVAHVGHSHPSVTEALGVSLGSTTDMCGIEIEYGDIQYPRQLHRSLPSYLDTFLFCNSGSEAVDLSVQLSRLYTNGNDVVVIDNAFHGSLDSVYNLSPKIFKANNISKADWVHVVAMPDLYRGPYQAEDPCAVDKYIADAREILSRAKLEGRKISCFIAEPMLLVAGCIDLPSTWLQEMYSLIRELGGICIADEVQSGMGRIGSHLWSFQAQNVAPDILIIGKPIGNGYPMACVVTSQHIAALLGTRVKQYRCGAVMDAVGRAVLDVLQREQLMTSAAAVGAYLKEELMILKKKHDHIGDVRGKGLVFGIEIVWSKECKKPARELAEQIVRRLRDDNLILANEGNDKNILIVMPPMCFTLENAKSLCNKLDKALSDLSNQRISNEHIVMGLPAVELSLQPQASTSDGRMGMMQPQEEFDDDSFSMSKDMMDLEYTSRDYQDLD